MPVITLTTNVKLESDEAIKAFVLKLSEFSAKTIGKDENLFCVNYQYNPFLSFAGTFDPTIVLSVINLYSTNAENAKVWSAAFWKFLQENLAVPKDRGYMSFVDHDPALLGVRGTTATELWGK
ncbi:Tautomerase/MIF superfamily [Phlebopus sp. FC_14]|nr:Tautomerase/MIF superfamily [Phlebopus sp. FC_14]